MDVKENIVVAVGETSNSIAAIAIGTRTLNKGDEQ